MEHFDSPISSPPEIIIFDSVESHFSVEVFLKEFLLQSTFPLCAFWSNNVARQYTAPKTLLYTAQGPFLLVMIVIYAVYGERYTIQGAFWVPFSAFLLHKALIAVRYASLSETEYATYIEATDPKLIALYRAQTELISGWLMRFPGVLEFEVVASAIRVGLNLSDLFLIVEDPNDSQDDAEHFRRFNSLLQHGSSSSQPDKDVSPHLVPQSDGSYRVSSYALCVALVQYADALNPAQRWVLVLPRCISAVLALLPLLAPLNGYRRLQEPPVIVFLLCSMSVTYVMMQPLIMFLISVVYDVVRQRSLFHSLYKMLSYADHCVRTDVFCRKAFKKATESRRSSQSSSVVSDGVGTSPTSSSLVPAVRRSTKVLFSSQKIRGRAPAAAQRLPSDMASVLADASDQRSSKDEKQGEGREISVEMTHTSPSCPFITTDSTSAQTASSSAHIASSSALTTSTTMTSTTSTTTTTSTSASPMHTSVEQLPLVASIDSSVRQSFLKMNEDLRSTEPGRASVRVPMPKLSFRHSQNIITWAYVRSLFLHFGVRVRERLNVFVGKHHWNTGILCV